MSIITISPLTQNVSISGSVSNSTITLIENTSNNSILTINQGIPGPPGPPGISGSGLLSIIGGSGINVASSSGTYTISSSASDNPSILNNGRLTIQSSDPAPSGNISGSFLYYTPYLGNNISLYNTSNQFWEIKTFNQISLPLSGMTTDTNYDIFIYDNNGTLTLERIAWSNNTSRSTNIIYQNGVLVKSGDLSKRYIGSIRSTSSTTTEDSIYRRFIYNHNNQINKLLSISDNTMHTYINGVARPYRNITTVGITRCEFISGMHSLINIVCSSLFATETASSSVGVSIDSTTTINTNALNTTYFSSGPSLILQNHSVDVINTTLGYHYLQLLQSGSSITTFYNGSLRALLPC